MEALDLNAVDVLRSSLPHESRLQRLRPNSSTTDHDSYELDGGVEGVTRAGDTGSADSDHGGTYMDGGYGWVITGRAISAFFLGVCCLPASWVLTRLGPRKTALIGVITASIGLLCSSFSTRNLGGLIFLHGLVFGSSGSLIYLTAYVIPSQFFMKKRGLATGIASCGGGFGGAVWAVIVQKVIAGWGVQWAFRVMALSMLLLGVPAALALRPGYVARPSTSTFTADESIFKSTRYLRILLAAFIASYPFFIPPYFISQYAQSVGLSAAQGALYSALFSIASGIGRVAFGVIADAWTGNLNAWLLSILSIALSSLLIWPHATGQALIIFFVLFCGFGSGGFFSLQSIVVAQIIGNHRVNIGIGWLEVAESFGYLAGPISAGALLDAFGGVENGPGPYRPAIYLVGGTTALAFFIVGWVRYSLFGLKWTKG